MEIIRETFQQFARSVCYLQYCNYYASILRTHHAWYSNLLYINTATIINVLALKLRKNDCAKHRLGWPSACSKTDQYVFFMIRQLRLTLCLLLVLKPKVY
jgi:hypothetical protein